MGFAFATAVQQFIQSNGQGSSAVMTSSGIGIIKSNPEKSKHLETATLRLHDQEIDFTNLRSETYTNMIHDAEHASRIPSSISFGTPLQDAQRRDLTINALFYNIQTHSVEDHLESGINDLVHGIIRTPLDPVVTFRDDPLRVLRTIRFAARFEFTPVPEIQGAIVQNPDIRVALEKNISRERIGEEVKKMLSEDKPSLAVKYMRDWGIFSSVFHLPDSNTNENSSTSLMELERAQKIVNSEFSTWIMSKFNQSSMSVYNRRSFYLAACLSPFHDRTLTIMRATGKSSYKIQAVPYIVKDSLKLPVVDANLVNDICNGANLIEECKSHGRLELSRIVWKLGTTAMSSSYYLSFLRSAARNDQCNNLKNLVDEIVAMDILNAHEQKPVASGSELVSYLNSSLDLKTPIKPGRWMTNAMSKILDWQFENGIKSFVGQVDESVKLQCFQYLMSENEYGRISFHDESAAKKTKKT